MEHLTEAFVEIPNGSYLEEEILEQFKSGLRKQPWTLIKAYKLKKLYQNWSRGIVDKELLEDCLWIAIENLQKVVVNGQILHYTDEISDEELDRWNEFIADDYGHGRYTEQIDRFSNLLVKLTTAKTDEQKMIALDNILGTAHGIGPVARWFVEGGGRTLDEVSQWRGTQAIALEQPKGMDTKDIFPTGWGWRAESNLVMKGRTARDIVDFEAEEHGNEGIREQAEALGLELENIPEREVVWLTATKKDAEWYSLGGHIEIIRIEVPSASIILATDYQGGYLVWLRNPERTEHLTQSEPKTIEAIEKQIMKEMEAGEFRPTVAQYHYLFEKYPEEADRLGLEDISQMYAYETSGGIAGLFAELYGEEKLWEQLRPPAVRKAAKTLIRSWEAQKSVEKAPKAEEKEHLT